MGINTAQFQHTRPASQPNDVHFPFSWGRFPKQDPRPLLCLLFLACLGTFVHPGRNYSLSLPRYVHRACWSVSMYIDMGLIWKGKLHLSSTCVIQVLDKIPLDRVPVDQAAASLVIYISACLTAGGPPPRHSHGVLGTPLAPGSVGEQLEVDEERLM